MILQTQEELKIKVKKEYVLIVRGFGTKITENFTEVEPFEDVIDCMYFALLGEDIGETTKQHLGQTYQEIELHYIEYITKEEYDTRLFG